MTVGIRTLIIMSKHQNSNITMLANADSKTSSDEYLIVSQIEKAVMNRKLPAGTKLSEKSIGEIFNLSRMHVRRALLILSTRGIVELKRKKGAFVASPTAEDAKYVFEARRLVEPDIIRLTTQKISSLELETLQRHVKQEKKAHIENNRQKSIELSGQFHIKIIQLNQNPILTRFIETLIAQTSLIIGLYGSNKSVCSDNEHELIVVRMKNKDHDAAANIMRKHLEHIEHDLNLDHHAPTALDLAELLG